MELDSHIIAVLGALTAAAGAGLVVWGATTIASRNSDGTGASLLAPTLAVDTLDPDLRVAYMRTLVLDARVQTRFGESPASPLGRELRRAIVGVQARRHAGADEDLLGDVEEVLDVAAAAVEQGDLPDERWTAWIRRARALRRETVF